MMKNSVFYKTSACLFTTTIVVGTLSCSALKTEPQKIDFSAFKNAAANIQYLSEKPATKSVTEVPDVTGDIVKTIEKEVKGKILRTRYAMNASKVEKVERIVKAENKESKKQIANTKNWNDIRRELLVMNYRYNQVQLRKTVFNETAKEKVQPQIIVSAPVSVPRIVFNAPAVSEINNKDLIKLNGYKSIAPSYKTFGDVEVALPTEKAKEAVVLDDVKVVQASTRAQVKDVITPDTKESDIATKENPINDELVVYDYSPKETVVDTGAQVVEAPKTKKIFDAPISDSVKEAIQRAVHKSPMLASVGAQKRVASPPVIPAPELEKVMNEEDGDDNLVFDYTKTTAAAAVKKEENPLKAAEPSAFTSNFTNTTKQVEFIIKASEINLNTQKTRQTFGYEFVPDYDRAERADDEAAGEIKLAYSLAGDESTQTGVIQSQGLIPTRVELDLTKKGMNVPLFNEAGIQKFLMKKKLDIVGNLLMVAIDPSIVDIELDSEYQTRLYFSENFKMIDSKENASYVLFLGVKSGNILMRYLLSNKESAQKIIYIAEGEMYYEDPDFVNTQRELYTFTTRSLLGKKVKELNINGSDVSFYGTKTTAKKKALNAYEIKVPELVENSRKYLEFKHLGSSLFVGTQTATDIEIPGKDFIGKVLDTHELSELGERCMVQVNLTKDLRDIKANGKNKSGEMFVETSFLDSEGVFSRDSSELSEKVFISGDQEGIFNVRLDYTDGSSDFLKTYCSEGSYLIEQL